MKNLISVMRNKREIFNFKRKTNCRSIERKQFYELAKDQKSRNQIKDSVELFGER